MSDDYTEADRRADMGLDRPATNPDHADWNRMQLTLRNHTAPEAVVPLIEDIRNRALELAHSIIGACPPSRERSLALTHLEDSTMWAVKSIVLPR